MLFSSIWCTFAKIHAKKCVFQLLNWFYSICHSFLPFCKVFCVDRKYCCQDTTKNLCLPDLKFVLLHLPFSFYHFGGFLHRWEVAFVGYEQKRVFASFEISFTAFAVFFLRSLEVVLRWSKVLFPRYGWKRVFTSIETCFTVFVVLV